MTCRPTTPILTNLLKMLKIFWKYLRPALLHHNPFRIQCPIPRIPTRGRKLDANEERSMCFRTNLSHEIFFHFIFSCEIASSRCIEDEFSENTKIHPNGSVDCLIKAIDSLIIPSVLFHLSYSRSCRSNDNIARAVTLKYFVFDELLQTENDPRIQCTCWTCPCYCTNR